MEYQKIANLLDNASNQPSKFRTKNQVEINDESRGGYTTGSDIKSKTTILKSSSCGYADATGRRADERNKGAIFKICAPFIKCISKINNRDIDNA